MGISLLKKLRAITRDGGVLLSDPTAMKALFLKSVEVLHHLDEASRFTQDSHRTSKERNLAKRKQSTFSSLFKSAKSKANDKARAAALGLDAKPEAQSSELERKIAGAAERTEREAELRSLRAQAQVASSILEMLKSNSVAIVDEVDVILDPLKCTAAQKSRQARHRRVVSVRRGPGWVLFRFRALSGRSRLTG